MLVRFSILPVTAAALVMAGSAGAAPKQPLFCDEIHVKTCRPPAEIGGVYPNCFCSVPPRVAFRAARWTGGHGGDGTCPDDASPLGNGFCFYTH